VHAIPQSSELPHARFQAGEDLQGHMLHPLYIRTATHSQIVREAEVLNREMLEESDFVLPLDGK
jgi:hypothetical protein